jgi:hypothetical protein
MLPTFETTLYRQYKQHNLPNARLGNLIVNEFREYDLQSYAISSPDYHSDFSDLGKFNNDASKYAPLRRKLRDFALSVCKALLTTGLLPAADQVIDGVPKFSPFTYEEARARMDPTTSGGSPYNMRYPTKFELFQAEDRGLYDLHADVDELIRNPAFWVIYNVGGKEEPRSLEKLLEYKNRTFVSAPAHLNILAQMATGRLQAAINKQWSSLPCTNGMSPQHRGWSLWLSRFSAYEQVEDSDRIKYDGNFTPEMHDMERELTEYFLTPEAAALNRICSFHDCVSFVQFHRHILTKQTGNSSGGGKTTHINSFGGLALFYYLVVFNRWEASGLSEDQFVLTQTISDYRSSVVCSVHGDDCVHAAKPSWWQYVTCPALNAALLRHGYGNLYDNETGVKTHFRDAVYLSMTTTQMEGVDVPRLISVEKLLVSLSLNSSRTLPAGMSRVFYELGRFWSFTQNFATTPHIWSRLVAIGFKMESYYQGSFPGCDREILNARAGLLSRAELVELYTKPRVMQACGCGSGSAMSSSKKTKSAPAKRSSVKRTVKQAVAQAMNAPTHRGFRNKGKVAAGRGTGSAASTQKMRKTNIAAPVAMGGVMSRATGGIGISSSGVGQTLVPLIIVPFSGQFQILAQNYVNPGNSSLFPRAQAQANINEKYRIKRLSFRYVPSCPSSTAGLFGMYYDPDPTDLPDSNLTSAMENRKAVNCNVWTGCWLDVPVKDALTKWYYTSPATTSSLGAIDRQNSPGQVCFFVEGVASGTYCGNVEIFYEFEFCEAKPPAALTRYASYLLNAYQGSTSVVSGYQILDSKYTGGVEHSHGFPKQQFSSDGIEADTSSKYGGFQANVSAPTGMTAQLYTNGATIQNSVPMTNASLALFQSYQGAVTTVWTANVATIVSGNLVFAAGFSNAQFTAIPGATYGFALKYTGSGAGTWNFFAGMYVQTVIAINGTPPSYGLADPHAPEFKAPLDTVSRVGTLPDAGLDDWLSGYDDYSYSITVSSAGADEKEAIITPSELKAFRALLQETANKLHLMQEPAVRVERQGFERGVGMSVKLADPDADWESGPDTTPVTL